MTAIYRLLTATLFFVFSCVVSGQDEVKVRQEWEAAFAKFDAKGTIVVVDERKGSEGSYTCNV